MRKLLEELDKFNGKAVSICQIGNVIYPCNIEEFVYWVEEIGGNLWLMILCENEAVMGINLNEMKSYEEFVEKVSIHMENGLDLELCVA